MANPYFRFKEFTVYHDKSAMKVTTDSCLFGAWCAEKIRADQLRGRALDIGAGTGLLSLMILQKNELLMDAVEVAAGAAEQAKENAEASPWNDRVRIIREDVRTEPFSDPYDIILSNPPFYEHELSSPNAARSVAHHGDGLQLRQLFPLIAKWLKKEGSFFLLLPAKRGEEAVSGLERNGLFTHHLVQVKQTPAHAPFRIMLKGGRVPQERAQEIVTIQGAPGAYTESFTDLLRPYYLYL